jgi:hypothetical protein
MRRELRQNADKCDAVASVGSRVLVAETGLSDRGQPKPSAEHPLLSPAERKQTSRSPSTAVLRAVCKINAGCADGHVRDGSYTGASDRIYAG